MIMALTFNQPDMSGERALQLLAQGEMKEAHGILPWSTNYTFLVTVGDGQLEALAIYKPRRGERPLWDFPDGTLCQRETGAFVVSEALGWHIVPPTVMRDGPHGIGMAQIFVPHDPERTYFTFGPEHRPQLARIALFDHVTNNADRKAGHCLLDEQGVIRSIDHGLCFHVQPKLRTVIWDFAGQTIPAALLDDLCRLREQFGDLGKKLKTLLSVAEIAVLRRRIEGLIEEGVYPQPGPGRNYPWPPV
jgi:uncharacterized repeat protein (TIGR03843 family)